MLERMEAEEMLSLEAFVAEYSRLKIGHLYIVKKKKGKKKDRNLYIVKLLH